MMHQDDLRDQIKRTFGPSVLTPETLSECASICRIYNLSPQELKFKWEAYTLVFNNESSDNQLTQEHFQQLRKEIQRDVEKQTHAKSKVKPPPPVVDNMIYDKNSITDIFQEFGLPIPVTPKSSKVNPGLDSLHTPESSKVGRRNQMQTPQSTRRLGLDSSTTSLGLPAASSVQSAKFVERTNRAKTEETLNSDLKLALPRVGQHKRCKIGLATQKLERYRYMFDKISEKAEALDDRIEYFAELLQEYYKIEDFANPSHPSQDTITAVGRICCDTDSRLNDQSVLFETSRRFGGLHRVKLMLGDVPEFALFPGQILGVEGTNRTGHYLTASKFLPPPLPNLTLPNPTELLEYNYGATAMNGQPLTFVVAAGPYTLDDNLLFEPLQELVDRILEEQPDLIVLVGCGLFGLLYFLDTRSKPKRRRINPNCFLSSTSLFVSARPFHRRGPSFDQDRRCGQLARGPLPHTGFLAATAAGAVLPGHYRRPGPACARRVPRSHRLPAAAAARRRAGNSKVRRPRQQSMPTDRERVRRCYLVPCQIGWEDLPDIFYINGGELLPYLQIRNVYRAILSTVLLTLSPIRTPLLANINPSFYPLFPPAPGDNLDFEHMPQIQLEVTPDVLILCSQLKYFAKVRIESLYARYCRQCGVRQPGPPDPQAGRRDVRAHDAAPATEAGGRDRGRGDEGVGADKGRFGENLGFEEVIWKTRWRPWMLFMWRGYIMVEVERRVMFGGCD
ncbi:DNA polymerase alpha subunit B N-terminal-domain-containing protein [Jimgerdemannia flammicorona]|uniref:DNA polymerase alpha subunit B n=1 Tax=Jimgerdemannia flammicorona TaxID=994334 RepID=A0A433QIR9_9FUNG|nr:DNA polymerase alpha subunit B N-terminal-domain-containing protein [Jimgerdemannia flammicorona]